MARSVRAQEASAAQARTRQAKPNLAIRNEFLQQFRAAIKEDPESGPALLEAYLAPRQGKQDPQLLIDISTQASLMLLRQDPAHPERALGLLDRVLSRFSTTRFRFMVVKTKAQILRESGKPDEGLALLRAAWPQVKGRNLDPVMYGIMTEAVTALRAQKKPDEAIALLQEALATAPPLTHWMSFYPQMIESLQDAEAMQWAALFFRVSPFEEEALERATLPVTRGWVKAGEVDKTTAFSLAQSSVEAPNPLQEIKALELPAPVRDALSTRVGQEKAATPTRIAMHLVLDQTNEAMLDARELMLKNPQSDIGVREVARVLKAVDGDVARANAALLFYRDGQGTDPLKAFFG